MNALTHISQDAKPIPAPGTSYKCLVQTCTKQSCRRGWCNAHYRRWRRHGDPLAGGPPSAPDGAPAHFLNKVSTVQTDECVSWPFARDSGGYGRIRRSGHLAYAHRRICEIVYGEAPTGTHQAAHACGNRACVNPRHLRWATPAENCADREAHGTVVRGERIRHSKLTEAQAREIHRLLNEGHHASVIAPNFGVEERVVQHIKSGRTWAWLGATI